MDLGDPFNQPLTIQPGEDGTFVVYVGERTSFPDVVAGFTTIDDLLIWMAKHGGALSPKHDHSADAMRHMLQKPVTELKEGDVVGAAPYEYQKPSGVGLGVGTGRALLMEATINGLRRTTAAETLAQRVAMANSRPTGDTEPQPAA